MATVRIDSLNTVRGIVRVISASADVTINGEGCRSIANSAASCDACASVGGDNCAIGFTSHERRRCTRRVAASASASSSRKNAASPASASASAAVDVIATIGRDSRSRISRIISAPAAPRSPITGNRRSVLAASRASSSPAASLRLRCNFFRSEYANSPCGDAREERTRRRRHKNISRKSRASSEAASLR